KVQGPTPASNPGNPPSIPMTSPAAVQGTTPTNNPGNPASTPGTSPAAVQGTTPASNPGKPSTPGTSPAAVQGTTPTNNPGNPASIPGTSPAAVQGTTPTNNPGNPASTPGTSPAAVQGTTPTNNPGNPPSTLGTSPAAVQGATPTNNPRNPPSTPTTSPQKVSSSTSLGTSTVTPAASPSTVQQKISPPASLGSSAATTAASPVPTHATAGGLGSAVASPPNVEAQGSQPSKQLTSTAASTGGTTSSLPPGLKDSGVSSPTSVTKQPRSSPSSAVQGLASSTRSGSTDTSVTPFDGSVSTTTIKASLSLPPGSINRVSEAATTPTVGADQRSHDAGSVSTKPATRPADQSPASAQTSAPAPRDQIVSSGSGHQHPNASFQNEVICKDQVQNNLPTMYLKEAKTCAEWRTASVNISFFESFCSTGQHAFNASREMCTVMLTSHEPRSQHWAVQAFLRCEYDPSIPARGVGLVTPAWGW
ncbi:PODXL protein, partial [Lophotis ruficrista]|nr:PODXL protein [Lophotis ruficrista]